MFNPRGLAAYAPSLFRGGALMTISSARYMNQARMPPASHPRYLISQAQHRLALLEASSPKPHPPGRTSPVGRRLAIR